VLPKPDASRAPVEGMVATHSLLRALVGAGLLGGLVPGHSRLHALEERGRSQDDEGQERLSEGGRGRRAAGRKAAGKGRVSLQPQEPAKVRR
jgi:hypothetical protein